MPIVIKNEFLNVNNTKDTVNSSNINKEAIVVSVKYKNGLFGIGHVDDYQNLLNIISKPINEGVSKNGEISNFKLFYNNVEIEPLIENIKKQLSCVKIETVKVDEKSYIFKSISHEYVNKEDYKSALSPKMNEDALGKEEDSTYIKVSREEIEEPTPSSIKTGYRCKMQ